MDENQKEFYLKQIKRFLVFGREYIKFAVLSQALFEKKKDGEDDLHRLNTVYCLCKSSYNIKSEKRKKFKENN